MVLATGYSDEILRGSGADFEVLRKPYDTQTLGKAIVGALRTSEIQRPAAVSP